MEKNKPDRRIQRSRKLLMDALIQLILDIGYQKITVQNIIDQANVGRSTFYAHFTDKENLLSSSFGSLADDLYQQVKIYHHEEEGANHIVHSLEFFHHAYQHKDFYRAMAESGGGEILLDIARERLHTNIQMHIENMAINQASLSIPLPLITNHLASSLLSMINWWTENGATQTPEEMNEMYEALVLPGFWDVLRLQL